MIKRVATAVILIPIVLLIVFRAPLWLFAAVVGVIVLITTREYLNLVEAYEIKPSTALTYLFTIILFASTVAGFVIELQMGRLSSQVLLRGLSPHEHPYLLLAIGVTSLARDAVLLAALVFLVAMMKRADLRSTLPGAAASALALAYISLPFVLLINVRARAAGAFFVFYLLVVVWAGDILAFLVGRSLGKRKLAPRISPNKSWEGTIASLAGATALGTVILLHGEGIVSFLRNTNLLAAQQGSILSVGPYPTPRPVWTYILLSAALNVAAQLGDLVESMLKRGAGVKDSGSLLPGHGGMLDRIDALLFAAPVLWYYALILSAVHIP
ncbi:MAG TPA: phosphatidate cytidylyltransferase [Terriglobales bacterium]|nr:phosphatidate cytidylyltransferase [Terriglobales bacterium]